MHPFTGANRMPPGDLTDMQQGINSECVQHQGSPIQARNGRWHFQRVQSQAPNCTWAKPSHLANQLTQHMPVGGDAAWLHRG